MTLQSAVKDLKIRFGTPEAALELTESAELSIPTPLLGGDAVETFSLAHGEAKWFDSVLTIGNEHSLVGAAVIKNAGRLETPLRQLYGQVIDLCIEKSMQLHRVWNFVPRINEDDQGLERYRQFNIGRWLAFEARFGKDLRAFMPAASAVGIQGDDFVFYFKAGRAQPIYFENPSQVPAYHYPPDYGPRPPGFARGVVVQESDRRMTWLSGTASIEGHRSIGQGDWHTQFRTTMHNMEIMFERMETPEAMRCPSEKAVREFKCYLRHAEELPLIKEWFEEQLGSGSHQVRYLLADICRAELDLEIEGSVTSFSCA
jgi:hypothetical protein